MSRITLKCLCYHNDRSLSLLDFFSSHSNISSISLTFSGEVQLVCPYFPYRIIFTFPIITCLYFYCEICFVSSFGLCPGSCCGYGIRFYDGGGRLPPPSFSSPSPRALSFASLHVLALAATSSRIHLSVEGHQFQSSQNRLSLLGRELFITIKSLNCFLQVGPV